MTRRVLLYLLAGSALWGAASLVDPLARGNPESGNELLYYPSGKFVRQAALGYDQAVAAISWLQTVQYYGEHVRGDQRFEMMYHMCDIVTDLDPYFEAPYIFGSFVLMTNQAAPEEALRLLAKGRAANPESWRILFESGFDHYVFLQDYAAAGRFFRAAAAVPGAPDYASRFAAFMAEKSGSPEAALLLWREYLERTENPTMIKMAEEKIARLESRIDSRRGGLVR